MHCSYKELIDKLGRPTWWDECFVPRFCDFHPSHVADIYANDVALVLVECQACRFIFKMAFSEPHWATWGRSGASSLRTEIMTHRLGIGDPPNYCCAAGATMSSDTRGVAEFWTRTPCKVEWHRVPELEIIFPVEP